MTFLAQRVTASPQKSYGMVYGHITFDGHVHLKALRRMHAFFAELNSRKRPISE
jgi:hypothetical protein